MKTYILIGFFNLQYTDETVIIFWRLYYNSLKSALVNVPRELK